MAQLTLHWYVVRHQPTTARRVQEVDARMVHREFGLFDFHAVADLAIANENVAPLRNT